MLRTTARFSSIIPASSSEINAAFEPGVGDEEVTGSYDVLDIQRHSGSSDSHGPSQVIRPIIGQRTTYNVQSERIVPCLANGPAAVTPREPWLCCGVIPRSYRGTALARV